MAILMILLGLVLLLPGLCAGAFVVAFGLTEPKSLVDPELVLLWAVSIAIAAGGIFLIRGGRRRMRDRAGARDAAPDRGADRHPGDTPP
ncbi:hypothetical protein CCR97_23330 [Rhodoplanes elegans]|uniref:Uncharacterized protein n=1 Tax=Rhodoplanes elegans TaxID=29408 RepID=A0A327KUR3_9BRAD|nr:hypothetical protein [Rhodoplanes elegans]MBK5961114.1 hypothetical protein [Rhodoplanes elegans]RAI39058.1 hypothetical protein CH338_10640 [Rhodoplanes elegans]